MLQCTRVYYTITSPRAAEIQHGCGQKKFDIGSIRVRTEGATTPPLEPYIYIYIYIHIHI